MSRRWLIFSALAPVLAFANVGCIVADAQVFIANAVVQGDGTTSPPGLVSIRFKYDVRDGKMRMKGHYRDPGGLSGGGLGVFLKFQGVFQKAPPSGTNNVPCIGALVNYIAEDPDHEYDGDIVDMNGLPLLPNEGVLAIDACDANHDNDIGVGDVLDFFQVQTGRYMGYTFSGTVVKGDFECKSPPDACNSPI
jgi:hypothetical protein